MTTETNPDDIAEKACDFLVGVLERMGISADIDVHEEEDRIILEIQTADTDLIVGRKGVVVDALQHLVKAKLAEQAAAA